jgi:hypothetical protein
MKSLSWLNVVLGIWMILAPWVLVYQNGTAAAEDVVLGVAIIGAALWTVNKGTPAAIWTEVILAGWVFIAPWVLAYGDVPRAVTNDIVMAILVAAVAWGSTPARPILGSTRAQLRH